MSNIIETKVERLKITSPSKNEKVDYFLMHHKESGDVSAVPVDAVLAKINDRVDRITYPDGFTKTGVITRDGNEISILANDFAWRIQLNPYTNIDGFEITLEATSSPELKRIDALAVTTEGTIVYHKGQEDEFIINPPYIPYNQLRLTDLTVFGNEVQDHTEPYIGEIFTLAEKEKLASFTDIIALETQNRAYADDDINARIDGTENAISNLEDGKEDKSNKTSSLAGQEASNASFPSNNGITSWIKNNLFGWIGSHATEIVDADTMVFGKSGVLGTRTFLQFRTNLLTFFQEKLISGTNIKTLGGNSLLGSGNIKIAKVLVFDNTPKTPLTGTTTATILASYNINPNEIPANCMMRVTVRYTKTGTNGNSNVAVNNSNLNTAAGFRMVANQVSGAGNTMVTYTRNHSIRGGNVIGFFSTGTYPTDMIATTVATTGFDTTVAQTIYVWGSLVNASDTLEFEYLLIEILS